MTSKKFKVRFGAILGAGAALGVMIGIINDRQPSAAEAKPAAVVQPAAETKPAAAVQPQPQMVTDEQAKKLFADAYNDLIEATQRGESNAVLCDKHSKVLAAAYLRRDVSIISGETQVHQMMGCR